MNVIQTNGLHTKIASFRGGFVYAVRSRFLVLFPRDWSYLATHAMHVSMQFLAAEGTRSGAFERLLHRWRPHGAQAGGRRFHPDHMYIYVHIHVPYMMIGYYIYIYIYMIHGLRVSM